MLKFQGNQTAHALLGSRLRQLPARWQIQGRLHVEPRLPPRHDRSCIDFTPLMGPSRKADSLVLAMGDALRTKALGPITVVDGVRLTRAMKALLIQHASGERAVRVSDGDTLRALRARGLIRYNRVTRPSQSIATPRGREVIAMLLAQMAEVLAGGSIT